MMRLFIGGGQDYWGPTAARDKATVKCLARMLAAALRKRVEIVTGGMPGIPEDFAESWVAGGGSPPLCVVSSEYEAEWRERNKQRAKPWGCEVAGATQEARRLAVTRLPNVRCALFVQGGKYSTHEIRLFCERGVPIVAFHGSGGAAGGDEGCAYEGWRYQPVAEDGYDAIGSSDPAVEPERCAVQLFVRLMEQLKE